MGLHHRTALASSAIALIHLSFSLFPAQAQTVPAELPAIVVTAPSPILSGTSPAEIAGLPPGILPVAEGVFAPVTVITGQDILGTPAATLGDTMFSRPGLTSSTFAPGASRPVIRGLDNFRVRIQENGIGAHDLSALGEDHGVPIDPLAADRVEVIRGPATLRWGSQAIGGVVSAENNRIPTGRIENGFKARFQGAATTVDNGYESAGMLEAGGQNVAIHVDAFDRRGEDYKIPNGQRQTNSWMNARGHSLGGSFVFDNGFVGASVSRYQSRYGIPGEEAVEHGSNIDLDQTKFNARGEYRPDSGLVSAIRFWFGATDYQHDERGSENGVTGILSTFKNREQEGRIELQHAPIAGWTGAIGFQYGNQRVSSSGEAEEFLLPAHAKNVAAYLFEEYQITQTLKFQAAGRIEYASVDGTAGLFPSDFLPVSPGDEPGLDPRKRTFLPGSASAGLIQQLPFGIEASLTGQYVERAPTAPELFAKGAHHASETFEIGNPDLNREKAATVEIGLRRAQGPLRFDAAAYYTKYKGFIYKHLTGNTCGHEFADCIAGDGEELDQVVYSQRDATFKGVEVAAQLDLLPVAGGMFGVEGQYDIVDARFSDGSYVPRIPPQRLGGGLYWRHDNWLARVNLLHAYAQDKIAENETPTGGYDLLNAELSYRQKLKPSDLGARELVWGVSGKNLLNDDIRNHVAFRKDEILQPGRNFKFFATLRF
jgi:iron complex outermembrane receptor protein